METFESVKVSEKFSGANSEQETPQFLLKVVVPFDRFFIFFIFSIFILFFRVFKYPLSPCTLQQLTTECGRRT